MTLRRAPSRPLWRFPGRRHVSSHLMYNSGRNELRRWWSGANVTEMLWLLVSIYVLHVEIKPRRRRGWFIKVRVTIKCGRSDAAASWCTMTRRFLSQGIKIWFSLLISGEAPEKELMLQLPAIGKIDVHTRANSHLVLDAAPHAIYSIHLHWCQIWRH